MIRSSRIPVAALLVLGAGLVSPATATASEPAAPCTVRRLEHLPGETRSEVAGGSPSGRWIVGNVETGLALHTVRWDGRHLEEVDVQLPGSWLTAVDDDGDVVGTGTGDSSFEGFAVVNGDYVPLGSPDGAMGTYPVAIANGQVAGWAELDDGSAEPFVWRLAQPEMPIPLELPPERSGFVVGMTPHGRVVVQAYRLGHPDRAFTFSRSLQRTELHAPADVDAFRASAAARGIGAGYQPGSSTALRFDLRKGTSTAVATPVVPAVVNASGVLGGVDRAGRPALVIGSTTTRLPDLGFDGFASVGAITPSGRPSGTVARQATVAAVRWTC